MLQVYRNKIIKKRFLNFITYNIHHETVNNLLKKEFKDEPIQIQGWIKSIRKLKNHIFLDVNDGSSVSNLQIVLEKTEQKFQVGASVIARGNLKIGSNNERELISEEIKVIGECVIENSKYPIAPKISYPPEYLRKYLHLRSRVDQFASLLRIRSTAYKAIIDYFNENNFVHVQTPILTSNDCEGGGEVFSVRPAIKDEKLEKNNWYFGSNVFLSVSGQLHLESAVNGLNKVFNIGPVFRAENSKSRLHLSEFYMLEAEVAFVNDLNTILTIIEDCVKNITKYIIEKSGEDVEKFNQNKNFSWLHKPFVILTYKEARNLLIKKHKKSISDNRVDSFTKEEELFLVKYCDNLPIFVIDWPKNIKPFYMRECENDPQIVSSVDLLVSCVGEMVGGGLREFDCEKLQKNMSHLDSNYKWYLDMRNFGGVPTGGFGLGFERYLQFLLNIENIKDTIPFPRWPHNCQL